MLDSRKKNILGIIVEEYIAAASPVGSESIAHRYKLGISPATVRNEMADLEEEGYIFQPYHSAGRIPSDKGYRCYVEFSMKDIELPLDKQVEIRRQFYQIEKELEEKWLQLAAAILSQITKIPAIITFPKSSEPRFRHLELISLQEFLAFLILISEEIRLRRQLLTFDRVVSQEELDLITNKFNTVYAGLSSAEISAKRTDLSPLEEQIADIVLRMMKTEEEQEYEEPLVEGLRRIFEQPEFAIRNKASDISNIIEILEEKRLLKSILPQFNLGEEGIKIIIGEENQSKTLQNCSVVISRYGIPYKISGVIGVIGPTRMHYKRAISATNLLSSVLGELITERYIND
jgi:heat-inducible transcriptional repressor